MKCEIKEPNELGYSIENVDETKGPEIDVEVGEAI